MRYHLLMTAALLGIAGPVLAQEPTGDWLVADGDAAIRIVDCDGSLWGVVAWERTPGRDSRNPDEQLRNRPTLGMPVLLDMQAGKPGEWKGKVYNSENGNTYDATIALRSADTLHIEGCALGFLCGGEDWTRSDATTGAGPTRGTKSKHKQADDVCSTLPAGAGGTH